VSPFKFKIRSGSLCCSVRTMDGFSGSAASRRLWSKALQKKANDRLQRRDPAVALPALVRRPSGQQPDASRTPLHAFLAAQLDANDRESYSRSQLRAMASSKLQPSSSNNLASSSRAHSTERLAPLDPASFERARTQQRRPLPGPLQAAINQVLAVRNCDERPNAREDRCGGTNNDSDEPAVIPRARRSSPCKKQLYGRRPEWRRYIRRIMMTNGIRGSTLARYRRLVGIVARKSLAQSFADAAEDPASGSPIPSATSASDTAKKASSCSEDPVGLEQGSRDRKAARAGCAGPTGDDRAVDSSARCSCRPAKLPGLPPCVSSARRRASPAAARKHVAEGPSQTAEAISILAAERNERAA